MRYLKPLMDQNFLEYASYVIKDRAIPDIDDGLKPVQRRILHTMKEADDGKFSKVANIVGSTMKLHPHGDASIGSALVVMANKEYFIEKQGNFGNSLTGDPASAPRYIEARLTALAKETLFNSELTEYADSYDGRNKEPLVLPCKLPVSLLIGAEGIAVGMSTRILPHNFNEVIDAQIALLKNQPFQLLPDFISGGILDAGQYEEGNGKVLVRARIEITDEKILTIRELPFGVTTESLIQSVQDAVNKGKFKLSSINDFTAESVEIELKATRGMSAEKLLKLLYAFTQCQVSISVNLLLIQSNQPCQLTVSQVLEHNTLRLKGLLKQELLLSLEQTRRKWHLRRMEMYFIGEKIYQKLEVCDSYEEALEVVKKAVLQIESVLPFPVGQDDIEKLLTLQIKRISRYDQQESQKELDKLKVKISSLNKSLKDIVRYTITYLDKLKEKYGMDYPRRTKIKSFDEIRAQDVAEKQKVYWDRKEGFLGLNVKTGSSSFLCSAYDKMVIIRKDGSYQIIRVPEKQFIGKDAISVEKLNQEIIHNVIYWEGATKVCYAKRFRVEKYILDREYHLFPKKRSAKILHLSQGDGINLEIFFVPTPRIRKSSDIYIFDELAIKGIQARGNKVSSKSVQSVKVITNLPQHEQQPSLPEVNPN
ncbi:MAG: DNA topoisomerase IV subunit A [SAR324 cluster bacterium]|nr:DNA topoisomerase IV subunit A [SAR324 cluster bacterium]MBL7035969.1 DNA topoisomerase IV subunit A [SAR324 cluster bacterium]